MCDVLDRVEKKGKEIGREEGRKEGRAEGRKEGRAEQAKATAIRMFERGLSIDLIADAIGFSIETVKEWLSAPSQNK